MEIPGEFATFKYGPVRRDAAAQLFPLDVKMERR